MKDNKNQVFFMVFVKVDYWSFALLIISISSHIAWEKEDFFDVSVVDLGAMVVKVGIWYDLWS